MSSATTFLNTLGIGAPNPAAYSDAAAVASQQTQAVAGLQSTVAIANTALTLAKTSGITSPTLLKLQDISTQGNKLLSQASTMTPATLEARRSKLESDLVTTQFTATQEQYKDAVKSTTDVYGKIATRVAEVHTDKTTSVTLLSQYDTLLTDVSGALKLLADSPPTYPVPSSGSSGSSPPPYAIPATPTDFQDRLDTLDGLKEAEEGQGFNPNRILRRLKFWSYEYLFTALLGIFLFSCCLFGGIITSNMYADAEKLYIGNRIFYFIYGALGFPFSILGGCIKPPFWVASIFPAIPRISVAQKGGGILSSLQTAAKTVVAKIPSPMTTVQLAKAAVAPLVQAKMIPNPGETHTASAALKAIDPAVALTTSVPGIFTETGTHVLPQSSFIDVFSYVLVDPKNPPAYQVAGKKTLWYLSLGHFMALVALATSYAVTDVVRDIFKAI